MAGVKCRQLSLNNNNLKKEQTEGSKKLRTVLWLEVGVSERAASEVPVEGGWLMSRDCVAVQDIKSIANLTEPASHQ